MAQAMSGQQHLPRDLRKIARAAREQGWRVELTAKSHVKFVPPQGELIYSAGTPSDWRGRRNLVSRLRRSGLELSNGSMA